jgi:hypothetical protein
MSSSWNELRAPYFEHICRSVLDEPMSRHAYEVSDSSSAGVVYVSRQRFLEFTYYVEDYPTYLLMVNIGFLRERADGRIERDAAGLWRFLRVAGAHDRPGKWAFSDEVTLRRLLSRLLAEAIEPVALAVLDQPHRLSAVLDAQRREIEGIHARSVEADCLDGARRAFEAGQYREAVRLYEQVNKEGLLASDVKKLALARRRAETDG